MLFCERFDLKGEHYAHDQIRSRAACSDYRWVSLIHCRTLDANIRKKRSLWRKQQHSSEWRLVLGLGALPHAKPLPLVFERQVLQLQRMLPVRLPVRCPQTAVAWAQCPPFRLRDPLTQTSGTHAKNLLYESHTLHNNVYVHSLLQTGLVEVAPHATTVSALPKDTANAISPRTAALLTAPIVPLVLGLAWPNILLAIIYL